MNLKLNSYAVSSLSKFDVEKGWIVTAEDVAAWLFQLRFDVEVSELQWLAKVAEGESVVIRAE